MMQCFVGDNDDDDNDDDDDGGGGKTKSLDGRSLAFD